MIFGGSSLVMFLEEATVFDLSILQSHKQRGYIEEEKKTMLEDFGAMIMF